MRIIKSNNKTVIVASGGDNGSQCPRGIVSGSHVKFADDYHNKLIAKKSLVFKLFLV